MLPAKQLFATCPIFNRTYRETTHVHQNFKRIAGRYWPTLRFGHRAIAKTDDLGPGVAPWVSLTPKGALNASSPSAHVLQKSRPRLKVLMVLLNVHEASGNKGFLNDQREVLCDYREVLCEIVESPAEVVGERCDVGAGPGANVQQASIAAIHIQHSPAVHLWKPMWCLC